MRDRLCSAPGCARPRKAGFHCCSDCINGIPSVVPDEGPLRDSCLAAWRLGANEKQICALLPKPPRTVRLSAAARKEVAAKKA